MPSQLINNTNISFMCARNFTYAGQDYKLGDDFPQEDAGGHIDTLVRSRYVYAVVDSTSEKPRHWHHHIWIRSDLENKLGILRDKKDESLVGSSLYNKPTQDSITHGIADYNVHTPWEETSDPSGDIKRVANQEVFTELVLQEENDEIETPEDEETEPDVIVAPAEVEDDEDDERVIEEGDLYDPADHGVPEVLDYLTGDISDNERERVLAAERNGKNRKGILNV